MAGLMERLKTEALLVADGAWGSQLIEQGLDPTQEPAEAWNLSHATVVTEIARSYAAHADLLTTNTFGANRVRLEHFGRVADCNAINMRAVEIALAALRARGHHDRPMLLGGAMGPMRGPGQTQTDDGLLIEAYQEQAAALAAAGVDFILLETMTDLSEARMAVRAVKAVTHVEIVCSFAFRAVDMGRFTTWSGHLIEAALGEARESGAMLVGANCVPGSPSIVPLIDAMRRIVGTAPLWLKPNAGEPDRRDGVPTYSSPFDRAPLGPMLDALGTGVIGGCCGTTPTDIARLRREIDRRAG
jgi:5-methyltetrahydrofolate--homocysteine methyltransferase